MRKRETAVERLRNRRAADAAYEASDLAAERARLRGDGIGLRLLSDRAQAAVRDYGRSKMRYRWPTV